MYEKTIVETSATVGGLVVAKEGNAISQLVPGFLRYIQFELSLSPQTAEKYKDSLSWVVRDEIKSKYPNLIEVFVKCGIKECIKRDIKGFYKEAIDGEIKILPALMHRMKNQQMLLW